ncbi:DUF2484 family protein [Pseudoroseicyclus sp. H15]
MSASLVAGMVWVLAGSLTAMLPMRHQIAPGLALLATAPLVIVWIGWQNGWVWLALGLAAFTSMMRHPIRHLLGRMRGQPPDIPAELRR